uniref:Immunoglobulin domain-containing protein n=1 Tax=Periophthalmus magnuspinnatus TaxID=409849 RepID=A0A3B4B6W6_9GOBI
MEHFISVKIWIQNKVVTYDIHLIFKFAVLEGRSLTIPCHYEPQYASYVKYWCRGRMKDFCTSMARTDEPRTPEMSAQKVMIYDDPVQLVFSITMTQLKEEDSGWYMCGVEIGGIWSADLYVAVHLQVLPRVTTSNQCGSATRWRSTLYEMCCFCYESSVLLNVMHITVYPPAGKESEVIGSCRIIYYLSLYLFYGRFLQVFAILVHTLSMFQSQSGVEGCIISLPAAKCDVKDKSKVQQWPFKTCSICQAHQTKKHFFQ